MTGEVVLPWVIDNNTYKIWNNLGIDNRDLIFLDKDGNIHTTKNLSIEPVTDPLYSLDVINIIFELLDDN